MSWRRNVSAVKVIDVPVVGKAKSVVSKAIACGMDISALKVKRREQELE